MPWENLRAGATIEVVGSIDSSPNDYGADHGTTDFSTTQNYSTTQTVSNKVFKKPDVSGGRMVNVTAGTVTFENCTFEDIGSTTGNTSAYRYAVVALISGSANVTFTRCKFKNMGSTAYQANRNDGIHMTSTGTFTFTYNYIEDMNSDRTLGNYASGDEGNRFIWFGSGATGDKTVYNNTAKNPGRNWFQTDGVACEADIHHNVVMGKGHNISEFEDMINMYGGGGKSSAERFSIHHNYHCYGGPQSTGTGGIIGDGNYNNSAPQWVEFDNNYIYEPGFNGCNLAGGSNMFMRDNVVFNTAEAYWWSAGLGCNDWGYTVNWQTQGPNTLTGNRTWFLNQYGGQEPPGNGSPYNHAWINSTPTNYFGNTWGDSSLNDVNMTDIDTPNVTYAYTNGVPVNLDLKDTHSSYFLGDTYTIDTGSLPGGLSMTANGVITGTPNVNTNHTLTLTVTNILNRTSGFTLQLNGSGVGGVTYEVTNPADGATGVESPLTIAGTAPDDGRNDDHEVRVRNTTDGNYWTGSTWEADSDNWVPATYGVAATHDAATSTTVLTDSSESWVVDDFIGYTVYNVTDGSSGTITDNTTTTVTVGSLTGGQDNDFDSGDVCVIADNTWKIDTNVTFTENGDQFQIEYRRY